MRKSFIVAAAAAILAVPAAAADLPVKAPAYKAAPVAPGYDWTGLYVGGHVGGGWNSGNLRADYLPFPDFNVFPTLANSSATGVLGGIQAGYNWQFASRWVLGVEGDFSGTRMNSSLTVVPQQIRLRANRRLGRAISTGWRRRGLGLDTRLRPLCCSMPPAASPGATSTTTRRS